MKIKWGDVTPLVDTDLASPLVPLSAVAGKINMNRDFSEIFTTDSVTIDNLEVPSSYIEELTISQILKQLNPYKTGNAVSQGELWEDLDLGFKLNGVAPSGLNVDQLAVSSMIESALRDEVKGIKKCNIYDEGLNIVQFTSKDEIKAKFVKNPFVLEIHDKYLYVRNETVSGLINLFGDNLDPIEGELSAVPVYLPNYVPSAVIGAMKLDTTINSWVASGDIVVVPSDYTSLVGVLNFDGRDYIVQGAPVAYFDNEAEYDYIVPAKTVSAVR
jgi:hypothetical protein